MAIDTKQKNKDTGEREDVSAVASDWDALALWRKYAPKRLRDLLRLDPTTVSIDGVEFFAGGDLVDKTTGATAPKTFSGPTVDFTSAQDFATAVNPKGHPQGNAHPPIPKGGHNLHFDTQQLRGPDGKWLNEGKSDEEKAQLASTDEKAWQWAPGTDLQTKIDNVEQWLGEHKDDHAKGTYYGGSKANSQKALEKSAAYLEQLHKQAFEQNQQSEQANQQEVDAAVGSQQDAAKQQKQAAIQQAVASQVQKQQITQKAQQQKSAELDKATEALSQQVQQQNNVATGATVTGTSGTTGTLTIAGAKGKGTYEEPYDFSSIDGVIDSGDQGLIDTSEASVVGSMSWYVNQAGGDVQKAYAHAQADLDHVGNKLMASPLENKNAAASKYYDLMIDIASRLYDATNVPKGTQGGMAASLKVSPATPAPMTGLDKVNGWNAVATPLSAMANMYEVPDASPELMTYLAKVYKATYGDVADNYLQQDIKTTQKKIKDYENLSFPKQAATSKKVLALQEALAAELKKPTVPPTTNKTKKADMEAALDNKYSYADAALNSVATEGTYPAPNLTQMYIGILTDTEQNMADELEALHSGTTGDTLFEMNVKIKKLMQMKSDVHYAKSKLENLVNKTPQKKGIGDMTLQEFVAAPYSAKVSFLVAHGLVADANDLADKFPDFAMEKPGITKSLYGLALKKSTMQPTAPTAVPSDIAHSDHKWIDSLFANKSWHPADPDNATTKQTIATMISVLKPEDIQGAIDKSTDAMNYVAEQLGSSLTSAGDDAKHAKMVGMIQLQSYYIQELKKAQAAQGSVQAPTPTQPAVIVPHGYKFKKVTLTADTKAQISSYLKNWHGTPAAHYNDIEWVAIWAQSIVMMHQDATKPPDKSYDGSNAYEAGLVHAQLTYVEKQIKSGKLTPEETNAATKMAELFGHAQDYFLALDTGQGLPKPPPGYDLSNEQFNELDYTKKLDWLDKHGIQGNEGNWDLYSEGGQEAAYLAGMKGKIVPSSPASAYGAPPAKPQEPPAPTGDKWQDAENMALWEYQQYSFGGSKKTHTNAEWDAAYAKWQLAKKATQYSKMDPDEAANAADELQTRIDDTSTGWTSEQKDGFRRELELIKKVAGVTAQKEPQAQDYPDYKTYYKAHKDWSNVHTTASKKAAEHPNPLPKKKAGSQLILPGLEDPYLNAKGEVMDPGRFNPNGSAFKNYGGPNEQEIYDAFPDLNTIATSGERNAMDDYRDGGYDQNQRLREDQPDAANNSMVKNLDTFFAKPDVVAPKHMLVYRSGSLQDTDGNNIWEPGEITWDDGFVSTSNNLTTAQGFTGTLFAIEVPKGQKAAYMQKTLNYGIGGESEILLPRGSRFVRTGEFRLPITVDSYGSTKVDYDHAEPIPYGAAPITNKYGDKSSGFIVMPRLRYLGPNYSSKTPPVLDIPGQRPPFGIPGYSGPGAEQPEQAPATPKEQQKLPGFFSVSRVITNGDTGEPIKTPGAWSQDEQDQRNQKAFVWGPGDTHKTGEYLDEYRPDDDDDPDDDPDDSPQEPPGSPESDVTGGTGMFGPVASQRASQGIVGAAGRWWQRLVKFAFNPSETRDWHGRWIGAGIATGGASEKGTQAGADAATIMGNKVGDAAGSNVGGFWHGTDDKDRYVKEYTDPTQAYGEVIANALYDALSHNAPRSTAFQKGHSTLFASELAPGTTPDNSRGMQLGRVGLTKERANQVLDGWLADVLTANWDVLGLDNDNILDTGDGKGLWRIDNGSAFLHRAQGARKPTGALNDIGEWDSLGPYGQNQNYRKVWNAAGLDGPNDPRFLASLHNQLAQLKALRADLGTSGFKGFVHGVAPGLQGQDADTIAQMLEDRTQRLVDKIEGRGAIFSGPVASFAFNPSEARDAYGEWASGDDSDNWPAPDPAIQKRIEYWVKANIAKYGEGYKGKWEGESEHWHAYMAHDVINELHLGDKGPAPYMWTWDRIRRIAHESGYMGGSNAMFTFDPTQLRGAHGEWADEGRGRHPGMGTPSGTQPQAQGQQATSAGDWKQQAAKMAATQGVYMLDLAAVEKAAQEHGLTALAEHARQEQANPDHAQWFHDLVDIRSNADKLRGQDTPAPKRVNVNLGVTPYRGKPALDTEGTKGYYQSTRYKGWLTDMRTEAHRLHVTIHDVTKVAGVWKGKMEPSASVWVSGDDDKVKELAGSLGGEYNQEGVMLFSGDEDDGKSALYSIPGLDEKERDAAIKQMQQNGLDGGRVVQERNGQYTLEVADFDGSLYDGVVGLGKAIGHEVYGTPGHASMLEGGKDYQRRTRQHKGAGITYSGEDEARSDAA